MTASKTAQFESRFIALARLAKALSHPARIAILEALSRKATCICGEIVEVMPLAQSTVSQHLKELKDAGLIKGKIDGAKSCYCLNSDTIGELDRLLCALQKKLNIGVAKSKCC